MTLPELLRCAASEIRAHRARSALTCLSLTIGVAATVYTLSQIAGTRQRLEGATLLVGPGRLEVRPLEGYVSKGLSPGLTSRDAEAIRRAWPELHMVYPLARGRGARLSWGSFRNEDILIEAVTHEWRRRDWVYSARGRFLSEHDVRTGARVCVLMQPGGWVKKPFWARWFPEQAIEKLLKRQDLLGRRVRLDDHLFTVVGILKAPPRDQDPRWFRSRFYNAGGGVVMVPITAYQQHLLRGGSASPYRADEIQVETGDGGTAGTYLKKIEALLKARHRGEKDFEIRDIRERIQRALERVQEYAKAIGVIGIVAILAGGIGIMNVTLATIFSRVREIGVRRALGATRLDIVSQFVAEAAALGLAAGAAGAALGVAAVRYMPPDPERVVLPRPADLGLALFIAAGTGILFSLYPAWQASRLDPIEALRYE